MLKEGYEKVICLSLIDPSSIKLTMLLHLDKTLFKIISYRRWIVLATGPQLIDDIRNALDDILSFHEPANEIHQPAI